MRNLQESLWGNCKKPHGQIARNFMKKLQETSWENCKKPTHEEIARNLMRNCKKKLMGKLQETSWKITINLMRNWKNPHEKLQEM